MCSKEIIAFSRKSPRISPKGHKNKRTKESASHHILSSDTKNISRPLQRIFGRPPEHPLDEPADMLKDKSFNSLWEAKIIATSYLHHFKTSFNTHTSSSQFATEAQIAKIKCVRKKSLHFPEKAPESARRATKTRGRRRVLRTIYSPQTPKIFLELSKGSLEDLQNTLRDNLQTCSKTSHLTIFGTRKSLRLHICIILKQV